MRTTTLIAAAAALAVSSTVLADRASSNDLSYYDHPGPLLRSLAGDGMTGFESPDFGLGTINGQNGWTASAFGDGSLAVNADIVDANPASGTQNLRITDNAAIADGTNTFAFSPEVAAPSSFMSVDFNISATGGSDYVIQPQQPSAGSVSTIVTLNFLGDILVADDPDGTGAAFFDTGVDWTPGIYQNFAIEYTGGGIEYSLDGNVIYTGVVWAGDSIETVLLGSDNFSAGETGDFDNLSVVVPEPASLGLLGVAGLALVRRRR